MSRKIYLIGSLRNPAIPKIGKLLRAEGHYVFDDWFAAGPEADDEWKKYEHERGHSYTEALKGEAAEHAFTFDMDHFDMCDTAVLTLPAGRSAHLELGYCAGTGKDTVVFIPDNEQLARWDLMYKLARQIVFTPEELVEAVNA